MRETNFHQKAWEDFIRWASIDLKIFLRLVELIEESKRTPFVGKGRKARTVESKLERILVKANYRRTSAHL